MSIELTVTVKDCERTNRTKFLLYESITFGNIEDPIIKKCVDEALEGFQGEPEDVTVRAMMVLQ
jgi:hypothetical protein